MNSWKERVEQNLYHTVVKKACGKVNVSNVEAEKLTH